MPTFRRGASARLVWKHNQAVIGKTEKSQTSPGRINWIVEPADDRLLRGLPCVGSRCGGAIAGTRPGDNLE